MTSIRAATANDAQSIARVHVDSWRTAYRGIVPESILDNLSYVQRESMWRAFLEKPKSNEFVYVAVEDDGQIVGFANGGPASDSEGGYSGELAGLYVLDSHRGRGIGSMLFSQAVTRLCDDGFASMMVWVLEQNPYRRFYEKMGGLVCSRKLRNIGEEAFPVAAYGWRDLRKVANDVS